MSEKFSLFYKERKQKWSGEGYIEFCCKNEIREAKMFSIYC
jgi:hypothetical protein